MTTTILIIVNVFAALAIIVLALMQQSKGDMGSAFGGGGSQSMFGSRGSANFLSRMTAIMCAVFFISSLSLAYIYAQRADSSSVVDESVIEELAPASDNEVPSLEPEPSNSEFPALESEVPSLDASELEADAQEAIDAAEATVEGAVQ